MLVNITFRTMDETTFSYDLDSSNTVRNVKSLIEVRNGIPASHQRLIFRGHLLKDDHTLDFYNITSGNTIHIVSNNPQNTANNTGDNTSNTENTQNYTQNAQNANTENTGTYTQNTQNNNGSYTGGMGYGIPMGVYMSPIYATFTVPDTDTGNVDPNNTNTAGVDDTPLVNNLGTFVSRVFTTAVNSFISNLGTPNTNTYTYTNTPNPNTNTYANTGTTNTNTSGYTFFSTPSGNYRVYTNSNTQNNTNTNNTNDSNVNTNNTDTTNVNASDVPTADINTDSLFHTVSDPNARMEEMLINEFEKIERLIGDVINSIMLPPNGNSHQNILDCNNIGNMLNGFLSAIESRFLQENTQNSSDLVNNGHADEGSFIPRFENILLQLITNIRSTLGNNSVEMRESYRGLIELLFLLINLVIQMILQFYLQHSNTSSNPPNQFLTDFQDHTNNTNSTNNNSSSTNTDDNTTNGINNEVNNGMDDNAEEPKNLMMKYKTNPEFESKMEQVKKVKFSNSYHM
ncbi:Ubiquitin family protein [Theileria parva strain Muguga]|uniref:Ubiquitin-like domain-containing protein n=1 Tax=Theileria parva TaxID=5875 RepID=Q4MZU6_THEPA|nr:Ubiquitin family protein [Theileria parva strain Muguga]EAN31151.1 Ubiquitin family protein [Theileria parva strain Muguga]|eukprot:XP_763434.1 hypothetical protein [Theileria parva strain Muguga]